MSTPLSVLFIVVVMIAVFVWDRQEKRYKKMKEEHDLDQELLRKYFDKYGSIK